MSGGLAPPTSRTLKRRRALSRLRYLASEVAPSSSTKTSGRRRRHDLPPPEAVDKLALSMNLSGHDYTPQSAPPQMKAVRAAPRCPDGRRAREEPVRPDHQRRERGRAALAGGRETPNAAANDLFIVNRAKSADRAPNDLFLSLAFAPDGRTIAAADAGAKVHLHSARSGERSARSTRATRPRASRRRCATWAATSELVERPGEQPAALACASDGSIRLWDGAGALRAKTIEMSSEGHTRTSAPARPATRRCGVLPRRRESGRSRPPARATRCACTTRRRSRRARGSTRTCARSTTAFSNCCPAAHPTDANLLLVAAGRPRARGAAPPREPLRAPLLLDDRARRGAQHLARRPHGLHGLDPHEVAAPALGHRVGPVRQRRARARDVQRRQGLRDGLARRAHRPRRRQRAPAPPAAPTSCALRADPGAGGGAEARRSASSRRTGRVRRAVRPAHRQRHGERARPRRWRSTSRRPGNSTLSPRAA